MSFSKMGLDEGERDPGTQAPPPLGVWTCKTCKDPHEH